MRAKPHMTLSIFFALTYDAMASQLKTVHDDTLAFFLGIPGAAAATDQTA